MIRLVSWRKWGAEEAEVIAAIALSVFRFGAAAAITSAGSAHRLRVGTRPHGSEALFAKSPRSQRLRVEANLARASRSLPHRAG